MVDAARAASMEVFGLSEHFYRPRDLRFRYSFESDDSDWGRRGWPAFVDEVLVEKERAESLGGLRVLLGAEVEYLPGYEDWTREQIAKWPFDYLVLSIHFLEAQGEFVAFDLSSRHWGKAVARLGGEVPMYLRYYDHMLDALTWGVGDVLGHFDLIKIHRQGPVEHPEIDAKIELILERCAALGMVLDLNARGLDKPCGEVYPSLAILRRALRAGVDLVTGDDSHSPGGVGSNLDRALDHARQAGYRRIALPARLGGQGWDI
jgi:histidinol-phosphatase (PHP family)